MTDWWGLSPCGRADKRTPTPEQVERAEARELAKAARARGEDLTGPVGLLKAITKQVIKAALEEEMTEHVGHDAHAVHGRNGANSRNGTLAKTVLTDNLGKVHIEVPRDRDSTFAPAIVNKRQLPLTDVDAIVLSLYAGGLTTGEISARRRDLRRVRVRDTVSRITDRVILDMEGLVLAGPLQRRGRRSSFAAIGHRYLSRSVTVTDRNRPFYAHEIQGA